MRRSFALLFVVSSGSAACAEILGFDETRELGTNAGGEDAGGGPNVGGAGGSAPSTSYSAEVLADQPVAYFRLEELRSPVVDASEMQLSGTATGDLAFATPAMIGNGLGFSSRTSAMTTVVLGDVFDFAGNQPMSVECWVSPDGTATFQHLVSKRSATGGDGWSLSIEPSKGLRYSRANLSANDSRHADFPRLAPNRFIHVVGTYDGTHTRLYVDGAQEDEKGAPLALPDTTESLRFGSGATSGHFGGVLDEIAIYDTALTLDRITAHFQARAP